MLETELVSVAEHIQEFNPLPLLEKLGPTGILVFLLAREILNAIGRRRNGGSAPSPICPLQPELGDHLERQTRSLARTEDCLRAIKDNTQATRDGINRLAGYARS